MMIENISLSRRSFLNGILSTGAFVVASKVIPEDLFAQAPAAGGPIFNTKADTAALHPSVYLGIEQGQIHGAAGQIGLPRRQRLARFLLAVHDAAPGVGEAVGHHERVRRRHAVQVQAGNDRREQPQPQRLVRAPGLAGVH